ncbi:MAG: TIM barrel protein, partial [Planctomycetota bacterium]
VQIDARTELQPTELTETGLRQLKKMMGDLNLRVGSVILPTRRGLTHPDRLEERCHAIESGMRMASRLGARLLLTNLGPIPPKGTPMRSAADGVVTQISTVGQKLGVRAALQTAASPDELALLLDEWPEATIGVDLNPAELILHDRLPLSFVEQVGRHVLHVHAVDAVREIGIDGGDEVELGRGSANMPELLGALEQHGYQGWATVARTNANDPIEAAADAIQFMRSV